MTARIIDFATARMLRDLNALHGRNAILLGLARRQMAACRQAGEGLDDISAGLKGFVETLEHHRRRCEDASSRLRRATDAMASEDLARMEEARDDLMAHMKQRRDRKPPRLRH